MTDMVDPDDMALLVALSTFPDGRATREQLLDRIAAGDVRRKTYFRAMLVQHTMALRLLGLWHTEDGALVLTPRGRVVVNQHRSRGSG